MSKEQRGPFQFGDRVQLTDEKKRRQTVTLVKGGELHSHRGVLAHDSLVGLNEGSVVANSHGIEYLAFRPLFNDFAMSMPRGAAIVYPKDSAMIVTFGDIFPGARVAEAGIGSGALTLALLRAVGSSGQVISIERREEFAEIAKANIEGFFGEYPKNHEIQIGDLEDRLPEIQSPFDRVVLDMLAPWDCVEAVAGALVPGGVVTCYVATVTQLSRTVEAFRSHGSFTAIESMETMVRGWHVEGLAVRPDHRMVAHTGFLMTARRLSDGAIPPKPARKTKPEFDEADIEIWTPGAVGARESSPKKLRKALRNAKDIAENAKQKK